MIRAVARVSAGSKLLLLSLPLLALLVPPVRGAGSGERGRSFRLDNGLRVFLYEKRGFPLLNVVTAFDVGSKDESDGTSGLIHLLEHCILFRGTETRSGREVSRDLRRHGAYFNAHTGPDLSVFELSLPSEFAEFGLRNQKDILFGFTLTQEELDEEKEVILEELNQMEDDPQRWSVDLVLQSLFPDHPYGRSVYGRKEVIASATAAGLADFHRSFFVPDNGALAVVGDFQMEEMERMVREVFGPLPRSGLARAPLPTAAVLGKTAFHRESKDVDGGTLVIGFVAPAFNDPDQYAMDLLVEILGRGVNPLLPAALRAQRNLFQTLNMAYFANRFGGAVVISMRVEPKDLTLARNEALNYLQRAHSGSYSRSDHVGDEAFFAFDFLESAKNQVRFAVGQAEESGLALAASLARFMLLNTRDDPGRYLDRIAGVRSADIRKVAMKYFGKGESAAVAVVPAAGGRARK
ncbi:MAG: insulinase family protein [Candidatus Aminicenantes bacterium]|nr:insulinase family protein [Candidatus Aminicenantes bacterium]